MTRTRLLAAGGLSAVLALTACSTDAGLAEDDPSSASATAAATPVDQEQTTYPVTVSSCGRDVTYDQAPSRVVLGYPRTLETLEALGVADAAHGYALGSYDELPEGYPSDVVEVSPDYIPPREVVIGAQPDLFLSNDEAQIVGEGAVTYAGLETSGSGSYVLGGYCSGAPAPTSLDVVPEDVLNLGQIFGVEERAAEVVADLEARVETARALGEGRDLSIAYVQVFDGKLFAVSGYPASGVIEGLGQTNEWADIGENFAEISTEEALTRTPDVLIALYVGAENADSAVAEVSTLLASTPAVQEGRVYAADETDFYAGGVTVVAALEKVAADVFGR